MRRRLEEYLPRLLKGTDVGERDGTEAAQKRDDRNRRTGGQFGERRALELEQLGVGGSRLRRGGRLHFGGHAVILADFQACTADVSACVREADSERVRDASAV